MEAAETWHRIAENQAAIDVNCDGVASVIVGERKLCIARHRGNWYAFSQVCPHAGALLSDGYVDGAGNVVCPLHSYRFSLKSGFNSSGEGYRLKTYPVEARTDGIYIKINVP